MNMEDMSVEDEMAILRRTLAKKLKRKKTKYVSHTQKEYSYNMKTQYPQSESFIGSFSLEEHYENKVMLRRFNSTENTFIEKLEFMCSRNTWKQYIEDNYNNDDFNISQFDNSSGIVHHKEYESLIKYKMNKDHISTEIVGHKKFIDAFKENISKKFEIVNANIEWIYSTNGDSVSIPLTSEKMPVDEMYPFVNRPIKEYYDDYINSSASILLLFGPPGTGKTTFIRGLLQHTSKSAIVTYDSSLLDKDYIFSSFIEGDKSIFIIEDADLFLKSRQEGNTMMHKFLNVGDGLVSTKEKKMIFSTNLPSVRDIDPALIRPGRCYDILEFRNLSANEGTNLAKRLNIDLNIGDKKDISLAEVFHSENDKKNFTFSKKHKVGFI